MKLLLFGRRRGRRCIHYGRRAAVADKVGERYGGHHKDDGAPCGQAGKNRRRAARAKGRLAAHAAKGGGNVGALAVLQQHHHDQHHADKYVNQGNKSNQHSVSIRPFKILVRKGGFEPPRLSAPPPQDGVSASFSTSALAFTCKPICALKPPMGAETTSRNFIIANPDALATTRIGAPSGVS